MRTRFPLLALLASSAAVSAAPTHSDTGVCLSSIDAATSATDWTVPSATAGPHQSNVTLTTEEHHPTSVVDATGDASWVSGEAARSLSKTVSRLFEREAKGGGGGKGGGSGGSGGGKGGKSGDGGSSSSSGGSGSGGGGGGGGGGGPKIAPVGNRGNETTTTKGDASSHSMSLGGVAAAALAVAGLML